MNLDNLACTLRRQQSHCAVASPPRASVILLSVDGFFYFILTFVYTVTQSLHCIISRWPELHPDVNRAAVVDLSYYEILIIYTRYLLELFPYTCHA